MAFLNEQDFNLIETELGLTLPKHFKEFHTNNHSIIKELRESDSDVDDNTMWIATDPDHIIEYNQFSGIPKTDGPTRGKLYIGGDGCGGSCFIALDNTENTNVYFVCPDDFEDIFDESQDDFKWDSDLVLAASDLQDFAKKKTQFNREIIEE